MNEPREHGLDTAMPDSAYELLEELELNRPEVVDRAREQVTLRVAVEVRPANARDRGVLVAAATSRELNRLSASCSSSTPVDVGSYFHLTFIDDALDLDPVIAVCERCSMLEDMVFELRFRFTRELDLRPADRTTSA